MNCSAELLDPMIMQGFEFESLNWELTQNFIEKKSNWPFIRECTGLSTQIDPLFDPTNPQILSLPKLKMLEASQEDKNQIV